MNVAWLLEVPLLGKEGVRKEALVMVYVCELTNLPFMVALTKAKT